MNERQINAFRQVMRLGSVTAAARALSVSQPAVSRLIRDLEADLGFCLFDRRSGKLLPLPEAQALAAEVERMFYGMDRLACFARELRGLHHARVTLATLPMASFRILPRALRRFVAAHDRIRVTHDVHTSPRIVNLVTAGQADLGIAQLPNDRPDVRRIAAWRCPCVVAMPAGHPLAGREVITPRDLDGVDMVALTHRTVTAAHVAQCFVDAKVTPRTLIESQPSYSACGLVVEGLGVAIVDAFTPGLFDDSRIVTAAFRPEVPFDLFLICHAERPLSRGAQILAELLVQELDATPGTGRMPHKETL